MFNYDSSSQLLQAFNPESGWTCYGTTMPVGTPPNGTNCTTGYDPNGNLAAKTDARGRTITYSYDTLNRVVGKTYSDNTPPVTYNYDEQTVSWATAPPTNTIGLLSSASVGGANPYSRYAYSYDLMGRPTGRYFINPNSTGTGLASGTGVSGPTYDLAGNVVFIGNDTGVYLYLTRDAGGHISEVTSNKNTTNLLNGVFSHTLFSNATYSPFGTPLSRLLGNGLTETRVYDTQGRLKSIGQALSGSAIGYSSSTAYQMNGNVNSSNDTINGNWTYTYDTTNRLTGATSAAGLTLGWTYDSFGNRKAQTATGTGSAPQPSFTFSANDNRIDDFGYDLAGNITTDNLGQSYQYDAEGRVISVSCGVSGNAIYKYDSEGQLVYESGSHGVQVFERDSDGHPLWIYNPAASNDPPYFVFGAYVDGEQIGSWQTPNVTFSWIGKDWLGTKRYETQGQGAASTAVPLNPSPYTSLPFGDGLSAIGNDPTHFTGKERDAESGNDYFGARYYSSSTGRFMSPDPSGLAFADPANPQSLNLYSYFLNNPLTLIDPLGLTVKCKTTSQTTAGSASQTGTEVDGDAIFTMSITMALTQSDCHDDGTITNVDTGTAGLQLARSLQAPQNTNTQAAPNETPQPCLASKLSADTRTAAIMGAIADLNGALGQIAKVGFVYATERSGGIWDFKNQPYGGAHPELDDFGNFHYGAVGSAIGLPNSFMNWAAGAASWGHYHSKGKTDPYGNPFTGAPYGDNPENQYWIKQGQQNGHC